MPSILVLGATGYIGGTVLFTLLKEIPGLKPTALVRNDAHIATLSGLGVTCVKGTNQDISLVTELASGADIVLNAADADDVVLANAVLAGCKQRFDATSTKSIYIHTSGLAVLGDKSQGVFDPAAPVYDDRDADTIKAVSPSAIHRNVERIVVDADEAGYVSGYIVSPSSAYGQTPSPIPRPVLLVGILIKFGGALKSLPYTGDGSNVSPFLHIKDLAAAYTLVLKHALSGNDEASGYGKYYIASGTELAWNDVIKAYGAALHKRGVLPTSEPKLVTVQQLPVMRLFGANTRGNSGKLKEMGWKPESPSFFDEVERDVENALKG